VRELWGDVGLEVWRGLGSWAGQRIVSGRTLGVEVIGRYMLYVVRGHSYVAGERAKGMVVRLWWSVREHSTK